MRIVAVGVEPLPLNAWTALRLVLWYFAAQIGVAILVGVGIGLTQALLSATPGTAEQFTRQYLIVIAFFSVAAAGVVLVRRLRHNLSAGAWPCTLAALGWRPASSRSLALGATTGILLAACYLLVALRLLPPGPGEAAGPLADAVAHAGLSARLLLAAIGVFLAPPLEEFLFRGILLAGLGQSWGFWPAAVGSTSLFALAHLPQVGGYWPAFVGILIMAAVSLAFRLRTRSLWPSIALHASYNAALMGLIVYHAV